MKTRLLIVCLSALMGLSLHAQDTAAVSSQEMQIYGAILDQLRGMSNPLVADQTSTFACGKASCNGFSIGGCNGLRNADEDESQRMTIVMRDIPDLRADQVNEFEALNQKCASIDRKIPSHSNYRMFSDHNISASWRYSSLVYFSRVAFNEKRTAALVNVAVMSATDAHESGGKYLFLAKKDGKWVIAESSAVWMLQNR